MDERQRKGAARRRAGSGGTRRQRPDRDAQRPAGSSPGNRQKPGRKSSRARRRRRNAVIRVLILIILIAVAIGGFVIWKKYGSSDEKADLEQYYEVDADNDIAVVVNNEVVRKSAALAEGAETADPSPGKIFDGQYYIEYQQ